MKKIYLLGSLLLASVLAWSQVVTNSALGQTVTHEGNTAAVSESKVLDDDILWEQPVSVGDQTYSIVSSYFNPAGWGIFGADDFQLDSDSEIDALLVGGSQSDEDGASYVNGISIYFYEDDNGKPAGHPLDPGSEFHKITGIAIDSPHVTITDGQYPFLGDKNYYINLDDLDEDFHLAAGTYWISVFFDLDLDENDFDIRWLWKDSEVSYLNPPKIIAPNPEGDLYYPEWRTVAEIGFPMTALAFTLYGDEEVMSTSSVDFADLKIYPNPASDFLYLADGSAKKITGVSATGMSGIHIPLKYESGKINISHLTPGTYVLRIQSEEGTLSRKFIKK